MSNLLLIRRRLMMYGSEKVVSGIPPLQFSGRRLISVNAFGGTSQNGTPTPDNTIPIVCNNGVLKARHQSGLPLDYTLLDFVTNTSGTRVNTGVFDDIDDFSIEIRVKPSNGSWYICQSRSSSSGPIYGLSGANAGNKIFMGVGFVSGTGSVTSDIVRDISHIYTVIGSHKNGVSTLYVKDETTGNEDTQTTTYNTNDFTAAPTKIGVWGQSFNNVNANNNIYYLKIRKGGELVVDYVPCQYNGENGFYDLVSQRFFGATTGGINAGNLVSDPVIGYADGTVETINVHGINIFDKNTMNTGQGYYVNSGIIANAASSNRTIVIDCKPNTKYSFWHTKGRGGCRAFDMASDTIAIGDSTSWLTTSSPTYKDKDVVTTITTNENAKKLYVCAGRIDTSSTRSFEEQLADFMIVEGQILTATDYAPYFDGGQATAEMLLKVGNYQDVQSIIDGTVTRNVGVKVLDGTESWVNAGTAPANAYLIALRKTDFASDLDTSATYGNFLCSHLKMGNNDGENTLSITSANFGVRLGLNTGITGSATTKLANAKQWLADQYAAGTPVIIIYPLATPTTKTVIGQQLSITQGTNIIDITQASLQGLELEVKYK